MSSLHCHEEISALRKIFIFHLIHLHLMTYGILVRSLRPILLNMVRQLQDAFDQLSCVSFWSIRGECYVE